MRRKIVIGTRGSKLALAQTELVKRALEQNYREFDFEIKVVVTTGDKDLVSNWNNSNSSLKSFFTKEIEFELLEKKIDLAVHSMKDMPTLSPEGLICGAIPDREDNRDVFISRDGKKLLELPKGAIIGTSSLRRSIGIQAIRSDFKIKQLRGNIHTRLEKLKNGEYDGILLAAAGLKRVGLTSLITEYLDCDMLMPAPAQGALYIQCREEDSFIREILRTIHNEEIEELVEIEREFSKIFDGGCHTPMGCVAYKEGDKIGLKGVYCYGGRMIKAEVLEDSKLGKEIAHILSKKIKEFIDEK